MRYNSYTLYLSEMGLEPGGIDEYTLGFAKALDSMGKLNLLFGDLLESEVSLSKSEWFNTYYKRNLGLKRGDKNFLGRKFNSAIYETKLWRFYYRMLKQTKKSNSFLIICSISNNSTRIIKLCEFLKIKYAIVFHGLDLLTKNELPQKSFEYSIRKSSLLIFNSQATQKLFHSIYDEVRKQEYIHYPGIDLKSIDKTLFIPIEELGKEFDLDLKSKILVVTIARLVKRKGVEIAINELAPLIKKNPNLIYLIAGIGPELESLKRVTGEFKLQKNVHFLGRISDAQKFSLLKHSHIFVMPNHSLSGKDFEGFGISFIEASYLENVVVGGKSGGAVEAIKDGVSGIVIDFESNSYQDEFRTYFSDLINNSSQIETISKTGRKYIIENFDTGSLAKKFNDFMAHVEINQQ
ncbi:MAG: glycosyltransferase family 4 protein [Melioribacteraceae bacterium]|nr:glycosyltransferase family 4 protein [Melioribacteraceae bacterium]MCF8262876.1 glycosyltransferase family 4 protein [Melioribacteraceae bacterium]MCF8430896.1 glycosyltransferase family 4 protein [Melioribacteraceae bacterium]